jgi:uncharacterized protein
VSAGQHSFAHRYGPWAIVTGASDGIGHAFAQALAAAGLNLVLVSRRQQRLSALADELQQRFGVQCRVIAADMADLAATERFIEATQDLDVGLLVAAAGFGSGGPLLSQHLGNETEMVDVNCASVLVQCWHLGQRLRARGRGGVVLLSSLLAFHGAPLAANYAASKAYIQSLAEGLRREWAHHGVDVIACAPGPVASGFARRAGMHMPRTTPATVVAQRTLAALGRSGTVRPGWLSKLLGWSLAMAPRGLRVAIMEQVMRGMTTPPPHPRAQ